MKKNVNRLAVGALVCILSGMAHAGDKSEWRKVEADNLLWFVTDKGDVLIEIAEYAAPVHAARIRELVRAGLYDGTSFHRVIDGFMAQGGNTTTAPGGKPSGLPNIDAEFTFRRDTRKTPMTPAGAPDEGFIDGFPVASQPDRLSYMTEDGKVASWIRHCPGTTAMARTNDPDSANSQFFLVTHTSKWLDKKYTAWGRIVHGLDNVLALEKGEPPKQPDRLRSARMVADMPTAKRPEVLVKKSTPAMAENGERDICALPPPETKVTFPS